MVTWLKYYIFEFVIWPARELGNRFFTWLGVIESPSWSERQKAIFLETIQLEHNHFAFVAESWITPNERRNLMAVPKLKRRPYKSLGRPKLRKGRMLTDPYAAGDRVRDELAEAGNNYPGPTSEKEAWDSLINAAAGDPFISPEQMYRALGFERNLHVKFNNAGYPTAFEY
jgi:hypothetical protein